MFKIIKSSIILYYFFNNIQNYVEIEKKIKTI